MDDNTRYLIVLLIFISMVLIFLIKKKKIKKNDKEIKDLKLYIELKEKLLSVLQTRKSDNLAPMMAVEISSHLDKISKAKKELLRLTKKRKLISWV